MDPQMLDAELRVAKANISAELDAKRNQLTKMFEEFKLRQIELGNECQRLNKELKESKDNQKSLMIHIEFLETQLKNKDDELDQIEFLENEAKILREVMKFREAVFCDNQTKATAKLAQLKTILEDARDVMYSQKANFKDLAVKYAENLKAMLKANKKIEYLRAGKDLRKKLENNKRQDTDQKLKILQSQWLKQEVDLNFAKPDSTFLLEAKYEELKKKAEKLNSKQSDTEKVLNVKCEELMYKCLRLETELEDLRDMQRIQIENTTNMETQMGIKRDESMASQLKYELLKAELNATIETLESQAAELEYLEKTLKMKCDEQHKADKKCRLLEDRVQELEDIAELRNSQLIDLKGKTDFWYQVQNENMLNTDTELDSDTLYSEATKHNMNQERWQNIKERFKNMHKKFALKMPEMSPSFVVLSVSATILATLYIARKS